MQVGRFLSRRLAQDSRRWVSGSQFGASGRTFNTPQTPAAHSEEPEDEITFQGHPGEEGVREQQVSRSGHAPNPPAAFTLRRDSQYPERNETFICSSCGVNFRDRPALNSHVAQMTKLATYGNGCRASDFTVALGDEIGHISYAQLQPAEVRVSQDSGYQVLSSFNIMHGDEPSIIVPGHAPLWKYPDGPVHLTEGESIVPFPFPEYNRSWWVLEATKNMHPDFQFDKVDLMAPISVLRSMFEFCSWKKRSTAYVALSVVHNTLVLGGGSPSRQPRFSSSRGLAFQKFCTHWPPGFEESAGHLRTIRYDIGGLNCVITSSVDAFCEPIPMEARTSFILGQDVEREPRSEMDAAEIKTYGSRAGWKMLKPYQESLTAWMARVPTLFSCLHKDGVFQKIERVDATRLAREWEKVPRVQTTLQKLVTLLSELRRIVKAAAADGQQCFAIITPDPKSPTIRIFGAEQVSKNFPDKLIKQFWNGTGTQGP